MRRASSGAWAAGPAPRGRGGEPAGPMNLADEEARAADTELKVLEDVLSMYKELEQEGMGELGTQALIKYYNW